MVIVSLSEENSGIAYAYFNYMASQPPDVRLSGAGVLVRPVCEDLNGDRGTPSVRPGLEGQFSARNQTAPSSRVALPARRHPT
jgi:hypothetical protein